MLIDEVNITVEGGKGGDGIVSFFPGRKSGPNGGDGGNGGNIFFVVDRQLNTLNRYVKDKRYKAGDGKPGQSFNKTGEGGEDLLMPMPLGTEITDITTGEVVVLDVEGKQILVAQGGKGGLGNTAFKSSTNVAPKRAEKGQQGEKKQIKIILKLIADFGLIGLPNAGKSSLLNELTAANVRIAPYPFTTLEPNLGVVDGKIIADIPGLIEGASKGRGLGIKFLRHIEKVKLLLHCIALDSPNVAEDYLTVRKEMEMFNPKLLEKDEIILLTKSDLVDNTIIDTKIKQLQKFGKQILVISIHDWDAIQELKKILFGFVG